MPEPVTIDELVTMAMAVHDSAMEGVPATDEHGNQILCDGEPLFAPDLHAANHALETIARLSGYIVDRREVTIRASDNIAEVIKLEMIEGGKDGDLA